MGNVNKPTQVALCAKYISGTELIKLKGWYFGKKILILEYMVLWLIYLPNFAGIIMPSPNGEFLARCC